MEMFNIDTFHVGAYLKVKDMTSRASVTPSLQDRLRQSFVRDTTLSEMVFELHIWGPAFGLPSIDPECIATVAYFKRIVPHGEWNLIADYDTSISLQGIQSNCIFFVSRTS
jgi:hypothetical protein